MRNCLPRKSNFAIAQAAATPNSVFNGTTIAAVSQREPDRGDRVGRAQRFEIDVEPARERVREHGHDGHDQDRPQETATDTAMSATRTSKFAGVQRTLVPVTFAAAISACPATRRMRQPLIALIVSSIRNETHSITRPSAAAPR